MLKFFLAGVAVAEAALLLNQPQPLELLQTSVGVTEGRAAHAARSEIAEAAAAAGTSYEEYVVDNSDDDDDLIGSDGFEDEVMDDKGTVSEHDFTSIADEDPVEAEAYDGEDVELIEADDDATNFGEDDDSETDLGAEEGGDEEESEENTEEEAEE